MDDLLQRFLDQAPAAVMVRAVLTHAFADTTRDALFDRNEFTDSEGVVLLIAEGPGDPTVRPIDPRRREEIERRMRRWQAPPQQPPDDSAKLENRPPSA